MTRSTNTFDTLELKNVGRSFGGHNALVDLNLTVRAGEFIALLGPSGCGKSTALNCLAGLLPLTHGEILIDGKRIDVLPSEKRDFGMVFQNYALFPHLSVEKNIAFGLQMRNLPKAEITRRVAEGLALVKLQEQAKKLPGQLSGGQQQRIAIARAIVIEPRLMLMDEPLSNLDAKLRLEMRSEIRKLHQALGLTTIYVTHDQEEALSLSDRVVLMDQGIIRQVGTPREVYLEPASAYAANFLGSRNLMPVRVVAVRDGGIQVETRSGVSLAGTSRGALEPGDDAIASIRPEHIVLADQGNDDINTVSGEVQSVEFLGQGTEVSVQTRFAEDLIARTDKDW